MLNNSLKKNKLIVDKSKMTLNSKVTFTTKANYFLK